jgi:molybdopterin-guanine dinucleotide biosynthesis protein A
MGRTKAWLPFGPELLLQRMVRLASEGIGHGPLVVVAAREQTLPDLPQRVVVARDSLPHRGPLHGLEIGLSALPQPVELVYASATDAPFLASRWIARLAERIGNADIAMPVVNGFPQPLCALYRRESVLPTVRTLLAADCLRLVALTERLKTRFLSPDDLRDIDPNFGTIQNINTLDEYHRALARAGFGAVDISEPA